MFFYARNGPRQDLPLYRAEDQAPCPEGVRFCVLSLNRDSSWCIWVVCPAFIRWMPPLGAGFQGRGGSKTRKV